MPFEIVKRDDEYCVIKPAIGGRSQRTFGCHATEERARAQLAALEVATAGEKTLVWKGADGLRLMFLVTSNSYKDREHETITTKALTTYVESQWNDKQFSGDNTLDYRHRRDIGEIVWADMEGPFLLELAKEIDTPYAELRWDLIERTPGLDWAASHEFFGTRADKQGGTFHAIRKIRTSVLPRRDAANELTLAEVLKMKQPRADLLEKLTGRPKIAGRVKELLDELVTELSGQGIEHKALIDEETGAMLEPEDFAAAIAEALSAGMETVPENLTEVVMAAVEGVMENARPVMTDARGDDEALMEERETEQRQIRAAQTALINELTEDVASLTDDMATLAEVVKGFVPLAKLPELVTALTAQVGGIQKQMKSMRPVDGVDLKALAAQVEAQSKEQETAEPYRYPAARKKEHRTDVTTGAQPVE